MSLWIFLPAATEGGGHRRWGAGATPVGAGLRARDVAIKLNPKPGGFCAGHHGGWRPPSRPPMSG